MLSAVRTHLYTLITLIVVMAVSSVAHAEADFTKVSRAFNFEALKEPEYTTKIFPPIKPEFAHAYPWSAIGNYANNFGTLYCSAFAVASQKIVTAKHCLKACKIQEVNFKDFKANLRRCKITDPSQPVIEVLEFSYFANVTNELTSEHYWSDELTADTIFRSGNFRLFKDWQVDTMPAQPSDEGDDWAVVNTKAVFKDQNFKALVISKLSNVELESRAASRKIKVFVASYPSSKLMPILDNMMLRLSGPCTNLKITSQGISLDNCPVDGGSSGSPILILDEADNVEVIGVINQKDNTIYKAFGARLTLDMVN